jgi:hypothetical protein
MNLIKAVKNLDSAGHLHVPRSHPTSGERPALVRVNRNQIVANFVEVVTEPVKGHVVGWDCGRPTGAVSCAAQLHRSLDRLDALASRSNGLTERSPEPLIGFDQLRVLIRRGNRRL